MAEEFSPLDEALPEADVVVWVASMPRTLEIDSASLRKPCLMIDGGYPKNLDAKVASDGVHVLKGGIVEFGTDIGWTMMEIAEMEKPQRQMFACFAEAMLLEFEECQPTSVGDATTSRLRRWISLGGFRPPRFLHPQSPRAASGCHCLTFVPRSSMARRPLLDFEKPLVELEQQIEQIRQLARDSEVDVSQQLLSWKPLRHGAGMKSSSR